MTQALILVNGFAASDDALPVNTLVTLANDNTGGETTYLWSITAQPPGPADALSSTTTLATTLTPTKEGNYRIQVIVNQGLGTERVATAIVGVLQVRSQVSQPAAGETTELGPQGWAIRMNQTIRLFDQLNADPGSFICVTTAGEAIGTPVVFSGAQVILTGLPGETTVPTVVVADASVAADVAGAVGVILGTVDGGAVGPGSLVYVRMNGLASVPVTGSPAAGVALAAAGTPATIVTVASLAPTDPYRYVGVSCGADPLVGANTLIAWSGAGAQVAAAASNVLWEWNGIDTTQFSGNPLPAPGFNSGMVNPAVVAAVQPAAPSGNVLTLSADSGTGGCTWWADGDYDLAAIKRIECTVSPPTPGMAAASSEAIRVGFVFGGDDTVVCGISDMIDIADNGAGVTVFSSFMNQFETAGPTSVNLVLDPIGGGYLFNMGLDLNMNRDNAATYGAPGIPRGMAELETVAFAPPPGAAQRPVNGALAFFLPAFFPPGAAWATSACNKIGITLGGAWTATSGAQSISILSLKFLG